MVIDILFIGRDITGVANKTEEKVLSLPSLPFLFSALESRRSEMNWGV